MPFNPDIIFSFQAAEETTPQDWMKLIKESRRVSSFEVPGTFFENDQFKDFYHEVFKSGKRLISVRNIIPGSLTRNLSSCSEGIKSEIVNTLNQRIRDAAGAGAMYLNLDLGLNSIKSGYEIQEIGIRAQTLQQVMKTASECGVSLLHSFRFPKSFPSSQEWKFLTILINSVLHHKFCGEIDIFPNEVPASKAEGLMKRTYYSAKVIRFLYDPSNGGRLSTDMHSTWRSTLSEQGFNGDIIFSPKTQGLEMLKQEFNQLEGAVDIYRTAAV